MFRFLRRERCPELPPFHPHRRERGTLPRPDVLGERPERSRTAKRPRASGAPSDEPEARRANESRKHPNRDGVLRALWPVRPPRVPPRSSPRSSQAGTGRNSRPGPFRHVRSPLQEAIPSGRPRAGTVDKAISPPSAPTRMRSPVCTSPATIRSASGSSISERIVLRNDRTP